MRSKVGVEMKRSFHTVDGEIIGESTSAGTINYATDDLGSVTGALVGGRLVNPYAYKLLGSCSSGPAGGSPRA